MDTETLLALFLPIFIGASAMCLVANNRPAYRYSKYLESRVIMLILVVAPIFVYGTYLVALRPLDAGNDTVRYLNTYDELDEFGLSLGIGALYFGNTEFLWWPLQSLLKLFLSSREWLIFNYVIVFCFSAAFYGKAARVVGLAPTIFALAFLTFFLVYTGNVMRQALAVPIGALGFYLLMDRRILLGAVLIAISVGLHWSSIVFLVAPALRLRVFDRNVTYLAIPALALLLSALSSAIIGDIVRALGIPGILDKFDLYFSSGHESHVGDVWKTANFWICSIFSLAMLAVAKPSRFENRSLHMYTMIFISLVFFGVNTPDFAERYIPFLLLILPLQVALVIDRFSAPATVKNLAFFGFFVLLAVLVLTAESSQYTLGYSINTF